MSTNKKHLQHVRSSEYKEGSSNTLPKLPIANDLLYGELALNFAKGVETISIRNSEDEIVTFPNNTDIAILTSATTKHNNSLGFTDNGDYSPKADDKYIASASTVTEALDLLDGAIKNGEGSNIKTITSNDNSITIITGTNSVDLSAQKPIISDDYIAVEYPKYNNKTYPEGAVAVAAKDGLDTVAKKLDTSISALTQAVIDDEYVIHQSIKQLTEASGFDENGKYTGATASMKYIGDTTNLTEAVQILDGVIDSSNININSISGDVQETIDDLLILTSAVTRMNESLGFTENIRYNPQAEIISSFSKLSSAVDFLAERTSSNLDKVDRSGDTMTGKLSISNGGLEVTGDSSINGKLTATSVYSSSDKNIKHDINNISTEDIEKAKSINFKSFYYNNDSENVKHYGVIAQDIEEIGLNNLVNTNELGVKSVDYTSLLILKIQQLEEEIKELKNNK